MDPGNMPIACAGMLLKLQYLTPTMIYDVYIWPNHKKYSICTRAHVPVLFPCRRCPSHSMWRDAPKIEISVSHHCI